MSCSSDIMFCHSKLQSQRRCDGIESSIEESELEQPQNYNSENDFHFQRASEQVSGSSRWAQFDPEAEIQPRTTPSIPENSQSASGDSVALLESILTSIRQPHQSISSATNVTSTSSDFAVSNNSIEHLDIRSSSSTPKRRRTDFARESQPNVKKSSDSSLPNLHTASLSEDSPVMPKNCETHLPPKSSALIPQKWLDTDDLSALDC